MKFRLLTLVFLLQSIVLARTQFITEPDPVHTLTPLTFTSSTAKPPTPRSSTAHPPTSTSSTAKPRTTTSSTAQPPNTTSSTAKPRTTTSSTANPPTPRSSTAQPPTPTSSTGKPPTPTSSTAQLPTTTSIHITSGSTVRTSTQEIMSCPDKQSTFYKDDINQLIDYVENDMKVEANLNRSVYQNVKNIANDLMLELNTYLTQLEDQPNHIIATLDDIKMKREKKMVPLVKTANTTLNELLFVENAKVAKIFAEMALLLTEKYKAEQFCKYACDFSFRALHVKNNMIINDDNYLCSTISEVLDKVKKWFFSFMEEQTKYIAVNINNHAHKINESIIELKKKLSEASKSILGVSMANVLHLQHDVIQAVQSIENFNAQSYKYRLGMINANLSILHLEFEKNILLYRKECVKCDSMAFRMEKRIAKPNILDQLLGEKATELEDKFNGIINSTFSDLYKKVNDEKFVEKIIKKMIPLEKDLALRTVQEKKYFTDVMQYAREKDRERMADLYNKTEIMLVNIINENEKLQDKIHHLS